MSCLTHGTHMHVTMIGYVTMTVGNSRLIKNLGVPSSKVKILQWFQKTESMSLP